jgi:hypothetical protein
LTAAGVRSKWQLSTKWQLSNGKVRIESYDDRELDSLSWIADELDPDNPIILDNDENGQWHFINPELIDYISIPAHAMDKWLSGSTEEAAE